MKKFVTILLMLVLSCITATAQFTIKKVPSKNAEKCIAHVEELSVFVDGNSRYTLHISANDKAVMKLSIGNTRRDCWKLITQLYIELGNPKNLVSGDRFVITDSITGAKYHGEKILAGDIENESVIINSNNIYFRFRLINLRKLSDMVYVKSE